MSAEASGMDIFSNEKITLSGGAVTHVHTGIIIRSLPPRTVISIRSRSSMAKEGILLLSPTIISHLDGVKELVLTFLNLNEKEKVVEKEDRIGQLVFNIVEKVFLEVDDKLTEKSGEKQNTQSNEQPTEQSGESHLSETTRDTGGFGSTGK
jgi:dUTPase